MASGSRARSTDRGVRASRYSEAAACTHQTLALPQSTRTPPARLPTIIYNVVYILSSLELRCAGVRQGVRGYPPLDLGSFANSVFDPATGGPGQAVRCARIGQLYPTGQWCCLAPVRMHACSALQVCLGAEVRSSSRKSGERPARASLSTWQLRSAS